MDMRKPYNGESQIMIDYSPQDAVEKDVQDLDSFENIPKNYQNYESLNMKGDKSFLISRPKVPQEKENIEPVSEQGDELRSQIPQEKGGTDPISEQGDEQVEFAKAKMQIENLEDELMKDYFKNKVRPNARKVIDKYKSNANKKTHGFNQISSLSDDSGTFESPLQVTADADLDFSDRFPGNQESSDLKEDSSLNKKTLAFPIKMQDNKAASEYTVQSATGSRVMFPRNHFHHFIESDMKNGEQSSNVDESQKPLLPSSGTKKNHDLNLELKFELAMGALEQQRKKKMDEQKLNSDEDKPTSVESNDEVEGIEHKVPFISKVNNMADGIIKEQGNENQTDVSQHVKLTSTKGESKSGVNDDNKFDWSVKKQAPETMHKKQAAAMTTGSWKTSGDRKSVVNKAKRRRNMANKDGIKTKNYRRLLPETPTEESQVMPLGASDGENLLMDLPEEPSNWTTPDNPNGTMVEILDFGKDKLDIPLSGTPPWHALIHGRRDIILAGAVMGGIGLFLILLSIVYMCVKRRSKKQKVDTNNSRAYERLGSEDERARLTSPYHSLFALSSDEDTSDESDEGTLYRQDKKTKIVHY